MAVIVAVPAETPDTIPSLTVATASSLLDQVIVAPSAFFGVAVSIPVSPNGTVIVDLSRLIPGPAITFFSMNIRKLEAPLVLLRFALNESPSRATYLLLILRY